MITTRNNQSLFDIAIQEAGTIEAVFDLARLNGISITDGIDPGTPLNVAGLPTDPDVLDYYKKHEVWPATVDDSLMWQGIGYWKIANDFIVS